MNGKRILSVTIKRHFDDSPDTSWLGEYSNHRASEYSIDREHSLSCAVNLASADEDDCDCSGGDRERNEYRYFNPSFNYVKDGKLLAISPDDVRMYVRQDYQRMKGLHRGEWCFVGIKATAEVAVPAGEGNAIVQKITSGGLWGIESDSDEEHISEIEAGELADLKGQLTELGFSKRAIAVAFKRVEREG